MRISENQYIDAIYTLYEEVYLHNGVTIKNKLFNKHTKPIYVYSDSTKIAKEKSLNILQDIRTNPMDFDHLSKFAEFIKVLDKVFFYSNNSENCSVYCDSPDKSKAKSIRIAKENYHISIKTEYDYQACDNKVTITVDHFEGMKIQNVFVVFNNDFNFEEDSDLMLINNINRIIAKEFGDLFELYSEKILHKQL